MAKRVNRLDHDKLARRTKAEILDEVEDTLEEVDQTNRRRLKLQADSVRHLLGGREYEDELGRVQAELADTQKRLQQAQDELRALKGVSSAFGPLRSA